MQRQALSSEPDCQVARVGPGQIPDKAISLPLQAGRQNGPDAGQDSHRTIGKPGRGLRAQHRKAPGLVQLGSDLGEELVGGEAYRDGQADLRLDPGLQPGQGQGGRRLVQPLRAGQVDPGFVQGQGLDQRSQVADKRHDPAAFGLVSCEIRLDDHRLRAERPGLEHRHGRPHAAHPGDIAAGGDHAPHAAADNDREVPQFGPVALLHRSIEGVAIHMGKRQTPKFIMGQDAWRRAGRTTGHGGWPGPEAIPAKRLHSSGQSQAAPRTPEESPCRAGRIGVTKLSEKTWLATTPGRAT